MNLPRTVSLSPSKATTASIILAALTFLITAILA